MSLSAPPIPFAHLHLGSGKLSAGLVVLTGIDAGGTVHMIARAATERAADASFACLLLSETTRARRALELGSFSRADCVDDLHPEARQAIEETPELLITTAITASGIANRTDFLIQLAELRTNKSTTFIACENDPGDAYPPLESALRARGVVVRRTMVNRLCFREEIEADGTHLIHTEEQAEWIIEGAPDGAVLKALAQVPYVQFVPDIEPYEVRKRWLVNGGHLAVALLADRRYQSTLNVEVVKQERGGWIKRLHASWIPTLDARYAELGDSITYADEQVAIWLRHEDSVLRILSGLKRADLLGFFRSVERKIGEPTRAQVQRTGTLAPEARRVFNELARTLIKIESYRDYAIFKSGAMTLRSELDDAAVFAYRSLLREIFPPEEIDARAHALSGALHRHRAQLTTS